jgi:Lipopolysaccharide kinase (Kdo/WaaP) family
VDPAAAQQTLHWGRNYLYVTRCDTAAGPLAAVVKQFRHRHLRDRLRRRWHGSKALKSWRIALALRAAGIATPEPLLLAESRRPDGPSFYVCRFLEGSLEARYLLRAANAGRETELFPDIDLPGFLVRLGGFVRRLHDAGFWHRDLSSGNILLRRPPDAAAGTPHELWLVDLNRARAGRRLGLFERVRDLSRMNLLRREHQEQFLAGYWHREGGPPALGRGLYRAAFHAFLWKNQLKKWLRGTRPAGAAAGLVRVPHAHIPDPPAGATARDKIVWDRLSDQPHQHAGKLAKLRVRLADVPGHAAAAAVVARSLPRVLRRYRELPRALYGGPVAWDGAGVCVRPWPEAPEALVALLDQLGTRHVLLRLHPWQDDHADEEALAAELHARGYELTFALPQNRELVRDPARWRASLAALGERFAPYGPRFQVGQAINRSKWGVWNLSEYLELARGAQQVLRRLQPDVQLFGPAVIDFEYHVTVAVLNAAGAGFHFDAVSALLYVDRRGLPEGRQAGFDTIDKVRLLRAIADTARNASGRCWITEMNWPLWEGPHSPAGRSVSVDEEAQADYLTRYFLLTLSTGLVERVFWWQLAARGYGLVDPADPRRPRCRPSFTAFRTLLAQLAGSRCEEVLPATPACRLYRFRRPDGSDVVAGWSVAGGGRATLPRPAAQVIGRDGQPLAAPGGREIEVGPSPAYFHLAD